MTYEPISNWKAEIFSEKSLYQVFVAARRVVGSDNDRRIVLWFTAIATLGVIVARSSFGELRVPTIGANLVHSWAGLGVTFASSILGFLIAGFAIFATATRTSHLQRLAQVRRSDRSFSQLKFVYFNFLYIFIHYGLYLALCISGFMLAQPGSPAWALGSSLHQCMPSFVEIGVGLACVAVASYTLFALLLIRSFIWNLYQALLFTIVLEPESRTSGDSEER